MSDGTYIGTIKLRNEQRLEEKFIVDKILPAGCLHLIGGNSGVGKTTWMLQMLKEWSEGNDVLGHKSHPCSWVYISCDRSLLELDRTMRRLGIEDWDMPAYAIEDLITDDLDIFKIFLRFPNVQFYVIEGFQALMPSAKFGQNKADITWMAEVRRRILSQGRTLLGTTHAPKAKLGDEYASSRSNFLGSQSFIATCSTLITIDHPVADKELAQKNKTRVRTDNREVTIQGRDFSDMVLNYTRDDHGRFLQSENKADCVMVNGAPVTSEANQQVQLDVCLAAIPVSTEIKITTMKEWAETIGVPERTLYRWVEDQQRAGTLGKVSRGVYVKRAWQ